MTAGGRARLSSARRRTPSIAARRAEDRRALPAMTDRSGLATHFATHFACLGPPAATASVAMASCDLNSKSPLLLVSCADQRGLIHAITGVLLGMGLNIVSNQEFVDRESRRFFMRTEFEGAADFARLGAAVRAALPASADVRVQPPARRRVAILVTKE